MKHQAITVMAAFVWAGMVNGMAPAATQTGGEEGEHEASRGVLRMEFGAVARSGVGDQDAAYALNVGMVDWRTASFMTSIRMLHFDWAQSADFVEDTGGLDPWNALYQVNVGLRRGGRISDRLSYEAMLGVVSGFEKQPDDSLSGYGGAYGVYVINSMWMMMFGAFYAQHPEVETDVDLVPILGLSWNAAASEGLAFSLGLPVTEAVWHLSGTTRLTLALDYSATECGVYRLADDSPVRGGGYAELSGASLTLRLDAQLEKNMRLSLGLSQPVDRELSLHDADGGNEQTYDVDKKPGLMISLSRSF